MPRRKVCPKCGYINAIDDYNCYHCSEDITFTEETNLSLECKKHNYFYSGEYYDECPIQLEEPEEKIVHETKTETPKKKMVKICPDCGKKLSITTVVCPVCKRFLAGVEATEDVIEEEVFNEEQPKPMQKPLIFEEKILSDEIDDGYFNPNGYAFRFRNIVLENIDFSGGDRVYIGRDYQPCLDKVTPRCISRHHCYLIMDINGYVYVGEDIDKPSTHGTAVYKQKTRQIEVVRPGVDNQIRVDQGDEILLAFKFASRNLAIIVEKK